MSQHLPVELNYLLEAARCYGLAWRYWAISGRVETHGAVWRQLADIHEHICRREDGPVIARWLLMPLDSPRGRDEQRQLRGLLRLLGELGRAEVKPFDAPRLTRLLLNPSAASGSSAAARPKTASALPARLRYLPRQARALGIHPRWTALASYVDQIDEPRFNSLCATADQMHERGDDTLLRHWLSRNGRPVHRDAALARSLLHVLDALEIF